jgi:hypothetical protein
MPRDSPEGHLAETREPMTKALYRFESCSHEMEKTKTENPNFKPKPETNSEEMKQVLLKLEELPRNTFQNAKLPKKPAERESNPFHFTNQTFSDNEADNFPKILNSKFSIQLNDIQKTVEYLAEFLSRTLSEGSFNAFQCAVNRSLENSKLTETIKDLKES